MQGDADDAVAIAIWDAAARAQLDAISAVAFEEMDSDAALHKEQLEVLLPPTLEECAKRYAMLDRYALDGPWRKVFLEPVFDEDGEWTRSWMLLDIEGTVLNEANTPLGVLPHEGTNHGFMEEFGPKYRLPMEKDISTPAHIKEPTLAVIPPPAAPPPPPSLDMLRIMWQEEGDGNKLAATVRTRDGCDDTTIPANKVRLLVSAPGESTLVRIDDLNTAIGDGSAAILDSSSDPVPDERMRPTDLVRSDQSIIGTFLGHCPWILHGDNEYDAKLSFGVHIAGNEHAVGLGIQCKAAAVQSDELYFAVALRTKENTKRGQKATVIQGRQVRFAHGIARPRPTTTHTQPPPHPMHVTSQTALLYDKLTKEIHHVGLVHVCAILPLQALEVCALPAAHTHHTHVHACVRPHSCCAVTNVAALLCVTGCSVRGVAGCAAELHTHQPEIGI